jgi:predicted transcriptional regulator
MTTAELAKALDVDRSTIHKQATRLLDAEKITREILPGGSNRWKVA